MKTVLALCVVCTAALNGVEAGIISKILDYTSLDYDDIFGHKIHTSPLLLRSLYSTKLHSLPLSAALPPTTITIHNKYAVPVAKPYAVPIIKTTHVAAPYPVRINIDKPYPVRVAKPFPVHVDKPIAIHVDRPYPVPVIEKVPVPVFKDFAVPKPEPSIEESQSFFKPINVPDFGNFEFPSDFTLPQFGFPSGLGEISSSDEETSAAPATEAPAEKKAETEAKEAETTSADESSSTSS